MSRRQAEFITEWLEDLGRRDLEILDVGYGTGQAGCANPSSYGITGTELPEAVLTHAPKRRLPQVVSSPATTSPWISPPNARTSSCLEVLAYVAHQSAFLTNIARLRRADGYLMLATRNRFALERSSDVAARGNGQVQQWLDRGELRRLPKRHFTIVELISVLTQRHSGILPLVNSPKLKRFMSFLAPRATLDRLKERAYLGHTLMALAWPLPVRRGAATR